jgi:hypothetical protein
MVARRRVSGQAAILAHYRTVSGATDPGRRPDEPVTSGPHVAELLRPHRDRGSPACRYVKPRSCATLTKINSRHAAAAGL